jgi:hypothetical protein
MHIRTVTWKHFDSRDALPFQQQAFGLAKAIIARRLWNDGGGRVHLG